MIDLRSDTVTLPTAAMREAIAQAELGDDVYGEDPTINRLEALAAETVGKEGALLVASGTMGNLIALLAHCPRGTKALVGALSHSNLYEGGGASALGGVILTPIPNTPEGELDLDALHAELELPADPHFAPPAVVTIENTHNRCGGELCDRCDHRGRRRLPGMVAGLRRAEPAACPHRVPSVERYLPVRYGSRTINLSRGRTE